MLHYDRHHLAPFISDADRKATALDVRRAHQMVLDGTGPGSEWLGWRSLLLDPKDQLLDRIQERAEEIRSNADVFVAIGIGGSYLGAQAVIDAFTPAFGDTNGPEVILAGHHLSPRYHAELLDYLKDKRVYVNAISKSGSTLEPSLAFRLVRQLIEQSADASERQIVLTTGAQDGLFHALGEARGYPRFAIPEDVGGRFSVLTPVGLLPIAVAGIDIRALFAGAAEQARQLSDPDTEHDALAYASDRFLLHEQGYAIELLAVMEPRLRPFGSWWQQLFGESEGKEHKGLFPAVAQYTTDLHSLGQYVQDGKRSIVELFMSVDGADGPLVPPDESNLDRLNYLTGQSYAAINRVAHEATAEAHAEGGVPNATLTLETLSPQALGQAIYFFEHAVAVSGYLLGVNPFDQPGVEAYKQKMFARLGRL